MGEKAKELSHKVLTIEPAGTKVIRLGTFHVYPKTKKQIGGGMFINSESKEAYMLVYFSQPATLTGTLPSNEGNSLFNIQNARAG
jgi:hypothetical protein